MQVKFEFGSSGIIFGRDMPLGLRKIPIIFSFCSLSPSQIDILNCNLIHKCVMIICRSSLNLVMAKEFSAELWPLDLNFNNFQIPLIISIILEHFQLKFRI